MKKILLLLLLNIALLANIGTVMSFKGLALVKHISGDQIKIHTGLKLSQGDTVLTQKKSRVQVMLLDETVVTIGSNSKFSFNEYSFDDKKSKVAMSASRGFFRSVTGKIGKLAPQRFKVKTASSTIGIRGTDFWGIVGGETEKVTCNRGKISILYKGKTIIVTAGNYATYGPKGIMQGKIVHKVNEQKSKMQTKETSDKSKEAILEDPASNMDVPMEDIADITQNIANEPFDISSSSEDRATQY